MSACYATSIHYERWRTQADICRVGGTCPRTKFAVRSTSGNSHQTRQDAPGTTNLLEDGGMPPCSGSREGAGREGVFVNN
jgi:hypothetical protein